MQGWHRRAQFPAASRPLLPQSPVWEEPQPLLCSSHPAAGPWFIHSDLLTVPTTRSSISTGAREPSKSSLEPQDEDVVFAAARGFR